ncbi:P-loop NTPase fold protein [Flavivirga jejuensis]|uniref:P-loop NTPase fold protein n=1 Tax=Flavivirga jejuensis TaxID=870487 RepID=A0ABT8WSE4_9FLAO|nr:P-loop NTPase fold protein [Flavivirga jejuensis]MDO5976088.1 P-loop NTPase fold protein [Flavivirga jejuensis]
MIKLNKIVAEIKDEAERLYSLKLSEELLVKELNSVDNKKLTTLHTRYSHSEKKPVNFLRFKIIELLLKGTFVDIKFIDSLIEKSETKADKNSFKAWGTFSILYPIISNDTSFDVKQTIHQFGNEIIQKLNIGNVAAKPFVVDFNGARNFGSDNVWMAIYNKANANQKTAIQLFFQIDYRGLICHLYDRLKDRFISSKKIEDGKDMQKQVFDFFNAVKNKMIQDNDDNENVRYRKIGVKENSIYKISHGIKFFPTLKEIQYCIDNNIVVVHEDTEAKGRDGDSQYENFKEAKAGDLFFLCWGNSRFLLVGQFLNDNIEDYDFNDEEGWKQRKYRFLFDSVTDANFKGSSKWWTPNNPSTCIPIPKKEYELANELIFRKYFRAELITNFNTTLILPKLGAASRQKITIDELVEPKLEVEIIAEELAGIIENLDKNKGQMLGIFGSWGRGKTFLYDRLKAYFNVFNDSKFEYEHITFNAWKYQETETIWAHLYGVILDGYIGESNSCKKFKKVFSLNIKRKGLSPLISIIGSVILSVLFTYSISSKLKIEMLNYVVGLVGVIGLIQGYIHYRKYYKPLKSTILSYSNSRNFNEILGIQAEIQNELTVLIKHWLDSNEGKKKRLLLFVDDIDRCKEEKILQIIDALRVMLDDEDLIERIIILVAVDEFLLERAIEYKYKDFGFINNSSSKNLIEEYMDKLFIGGIKLPKLNEKEQAIILQTYAINNKILEHVENTQQEPFEEDEIETSSFDEKSHEIIIFPDVITSDQIETQNEFFLLKKELTLLEKYSKTISENITPRQLRIYMYRYLLAKNIASSYLNQETGEGQLSDSYCDFIAKAIALKSNETKTFSFTNSVSISLVENPTLKLFTPKLIEMIVPY